MADRGGYIGRNPGDSAVIVARQTFTPSGVTTDFTFTSGYVVGYMDVYLNGVRLINATDYTASNGSSVGLTSAAQSGDVLELVAFKAFNAASVSEASGNFTVGSKLTVSGISSLTDVVSSGIVTADSFYGDGSNLTGLPGQRDFWTKTAAGINTTVSVGIGTTRPDSIARSNNTKILNVGILTAYQVYVSGMTSVGDVVSSGIVTADSFYGSGANLTNLPGQVDLWSKTAAGINTLSSVGIGTTNPVSDLTVGPVGTSGTSLFVHGDARVVGVLTATAGLTYGTTDVQTAIEAKASTGKAIAMAMVFG